MVNTILVENEFATVQYHCISHKAACKILNHEVRFSWNSYVHAQFAAYLPRAHVQGVKQSVCLSVVVVSTKIARSRVLGIYAC